MSKQRHRKISSETRNRIKLGNRDEQYAFDFPGDEEIKKAGIYTGLFYEGDSVV